MTSAIAELVAVASAQGVETFHIDPPGLGVGLRISIVRTSPPGGDAASARPAAIVYATDADFMFGTLVDAARIGCHAGEIAPAIFVGIGYADETGDMAFASSRRLLDLYRGPRREFDAGAYGRIPFGAAENFYSALRDHVVPAVERHLAEFELRCRILLGTSAGGHFATYALSRDPTLFSAYAMMSPVLTDLQLTQEGLIVASRGAEDLVRMIEDLPEGALPPGLRVFLSAGEREEDPGSMSAGFAINSNALRMRSALARRDVDTRYVQFAGETHASVVGAAIGAALRFLLPLNETPDR